MTTDLGELWNSKPNLVKQAISTHRLCAITLDRTSFIWPTSDLDRSEPPNFALIMENVVSTFDRWW